MDLELSDEQQWLSESVETLLARESHTGRLWGSLVEFGALSVGGDDGLGAIELCLIARALGAHLSPVPYLGSAAVRFAREQRLDRFAEPLLLVAELQVHSSYSCGSARTRSAMMLRWICCVPPYTLAARE